MPNKCLKANSLRGIKNGPRKRANADPALDTRTYGGGPTMPENTGKLQQNDSASNPEHLGTWQQVGEVIARQIAPEVARRVRERQEGGK